MMKRSTAKFQKTSNISKRSATTRSKKISNKTKKSTARSQKTGNALNAQFYSTLFQLPNVGLKPYYTAAGLNTHLDLETASKKQLLPTNRDAAILEIGSGDGRVIVYLTAKGYTNITGIEKNETAVKNLKRKFQNECRNSVVKIIEKDIKLYRSRSHFDCILWLWCGFNDFSKEEQIDLFNKAIQLLRPNGKLIIDNPKSGAMTNVESAGIKIYNGHTYSHTVKIHGSTYRAYIPSPRELRMFARHSPSVEIHRITEYNTTEKDRPRQLFTYLKH